MATEIYSENHNENLDSKYIVESELGNSLDSTVYKVRDSFSDKICVLKVFKPYSRSLKNEKELNEILMNSESPFFIKYIPPTTYNFYSRSNLLFEFASKGNLFKYLSTVKEGFDETNCKVLFYKIIKPLQTLHKIGICHRDIRPQNILFDGEKFVLKIGNFGFSALINGKDGKIMQKGKIGSEEEYMAPEVKRGKEYDGGKVDIYSAGVLLFTLRTGKNPFPISQVFNVGNRTKKLYKYIKDKDEKKFWYILEKLGIDGFSPEFKDLFFKMVAFNPNERPTIEEILNHDWMKDITKLNEEEFKKYEENMIAELKSRERILENFRESKVI